MWRTLRNQHLAASPGGARFHVAFMLMAALTGALFLVADYPLWRVACIVIVPVVMGTAETLFARRIKPEHFDRVHKNMALLGLLVLGVMVALTNGLHGPMAPFPFLAALLPQLLFGESRFVIGQHLRVIAVILTIGFLPADWLGPPLTNAHQAIIMGVVATTALVGVSQRMRLFMRAAKAGLRELDRMREERLAEASERLVRMQSVSSRIAHELKNPLAAVKSLVQLSMKTSSDTERERLEVAQEEIARMETILRDYLSFSRPLDDLKLASVQIEEVIADVHEVLSARAETAGVAFVLTPSPVVVQADARRLKEALINLVGNAIEATSAGGSVILSCKPALIGAHITVADSGRGMTPDELERVGTPYYTTRDGGTGLGVHLARGVIAQHGGTVAYASAPDVGTTVTITLPMAPPSVMGLTYDTADTAPKCLREGNLC